MNLVIIIGIFIAATFSGGNAELTFSPEETLFTYTRCMEENFQQDYALVQKWKVWELPVNDKTACYAKCVLIELGLFDDGSNSFMSGNILDQYNRYKSYTDQDEDGVNQFSEAIKNLGTVDDSSCMTVLNKYLPVFEQFKEVQRNLYFGKKEITEKVYAADDAVKKEGETLFRFCERRNYANGDADLCKLRKSGVSDDKHDRHMDCLFHGMRYMDENGNVNAQEIKRDLHLIGVTDQDAEVDKVLGECKVEEPRKASSYNDCLFKNPNLQSHMMPAFDYREVRSESYSYFLVGPKPYNRDEVVAKVKKYDQDAGC